MFPLTDMEEAERKDTHSIALLKILKLEAFCQPIELFERKIFEMSRVLSKSYMVKFDVRKEQTRM